MSGLFITIEGPDGSGKTTQINLLKEYLENNNHNILLTREPGGTDISEKIRQIILDVKNNKMDDMTETLLYAAARAQHVAEKIKPALDQNTIVISDRFLDSSLVYQGFARGIGIEIIEKINHYATKGLEPDITFLLYLTAEQGINRKKNQTKLDRLEQEKLAFHKKVCKGYKELAIKYPNRIKLIDATKTIDEIHNIIIDKLNEVLQINQHLSI